MKNESRGACWIYGWHSVRAVMEARPRAVKELMVAVKGKADVGGKVTSKVAHTEGVAIEVTSTEVPGSKMELMERASELGIRVRQVAGKEMVEITGTDSSQGVAVRAELPGYAELDDVMEREPHVVVLLDSVTDPQNLGAIARSAEALGASGIVVAKDRSAGITAAAHKASAGALEWLPVARVVNISRAIMELKDHGYWVYGADPEGGDLLENTEFSARCALVIGSEGKGIREGVKKQLDFHVKIIQPGRTKSLNASAASAIILFTALRTRRH